MTSRISLLFASTALTVAFAVPALAAMQTQGNAPDQCSSLCAAVADADDLSAPLIRVSGDDDDEDEDGGWFRRGHDDDDDEEDDDEGCDDDEGEGGGCTGVRGNAAPAGTVAPPANGLFGNGAPPVAVTN